MWMCNRNECGTSKVVSNVVLCPEAYHTIYQKVQNNQSSTWEILGLTKILAAYLSLLMKDM